MKGVGIALGQLARTGEGTDGILKLPAKMLCKLLAQPGSLRDSEYKLAIECALKRVEDMDAKDCIRILGVLTRHGVVDESQMAALNQLGARLGDKMSEASLADIASLAEKLGNANVQSIPLFSRFSVVLGLRLSGATASQLTQIAVGFSKARFADRQLFPRLGQCAVRQLHLFSDNELPAFLSAFSVVGICHEILLTAAVPKLSQRSSHLTALDLALTAFAYAQFFLVYPVLVSALRKRLPTCAHELPPVRLAELIVSCARLTFQSHQLSVVFARDVKLSGLSDPLFGQVAKSLAVLDLAMSPQVQRQLNSECESRLARAYGVDASHTAEWTLDLMECAADTADSARKLRGGQFPEFVATVLTSGVQTLTELCPLLGAQDIARFYRSLRRLPPSLVGPAEGIGILWPVHDALAERATTLAAVESFNFVELTSALFSQMCLYPQMWAGIDGDSFENPRWHKLQTSWDALRSVWNDFDNNRPEGDAITQQQVAALKMAFLGNGAPFDSTLSFNGAQEGSRSRPVAMELRDILTRLGYETKGPIWQGPVEVHAVTANLAFVVVPEDMHFRRHRTLALISESTEDQVHIPTTVDNLELCFERAAELHLLRRCGWTTIPIRFSAWRGLTIEGQRSLLLDIIHGSSSPTAPRERYKHF